MSRPCRRTPSLEGKAARWADRKACKARKAAKKLSKAATGAMLPPVATVYAAEAKPAAVSLIHTLSPVVSTPRRQVTQAASATSGYCEKIILVLIMSFDTSRDV